LSLVKSPLGVGVTGEEVEDETRDLDPLLDWVDKKVELDILSSSLLPGVTGAALDGRVRISGD
jgi:hypothetical protein